MLKKLFPSIYFLLFIGILGLPALDRKLHFFPTATLVEKRELAPRPEYKSEPSVRQTIKDFDAYWSDNFGGREFLISLKAKLWVRYLYESPVPYVLVGKDGWLYYKSEAKDEGDGAGISDYLGQDSLTKGELTQIIDSINKVQSLLADRGIDLILVVPPRKSSIYSEMLPYPLTNISATTRLDQLTAAIPKDINFVDLRNSLIRAKKDHTVYLHTDSHWTDYGALIAVNQLLSYFPAKYHVTPTPLTDFVIEEKTENGEGDLASMMAARGIFPETNVVVTPINPVELTHQSYVNAKENRKGEVWQRPGFEGAHVIMFGDSFRTSMEKYLAPHFAQTDVITFTPRYKLNFNIIDDFAPDIVIWEVTERYLDKFIQ